MAKVGELSEEIREKLRGNFSEDTDMDEVAKSWLEMRAEMRQRPKIPGPDASDESRESFYALLGRPEGPDKYQLPDGISDVPVEDKLREVAYSKGLSQDQFTALAQLAGDVRASADSAIQEARSEWEQKIREQHGDKTDQRMEQAERGLDYILGDDTKAKEIVKKIGLDRSPRLFQHLMEVATKMANDNAPGGGTSEARSGPGPAELYKEGMEIMRSEAYRKGEVHPEFQFARARLTEIIAALDHQGFDGLRDPRFRRMPTINLPEGSRFAT